MFELGLIPAAGEGVRAYPATTWMPKVMLEIAGRPIIERNVEILREAFGIKKIVIITGHMAEMIEEHLGDGDKFGVKITYVRCPDPKIGLARGMLLAEPHLDRPFVTILGDEVYLDSNHSQLQPQDQDWFAWCAVHRTSDPRRIQKNYCLTITDGRIVDLEEKPEHPTGDMLGCGTYAFQTSIFERIRATAPSQRSGRVELTDVIREAAQDGLIVRPFEVSGDYLNVNCLEDHHTANHLARTKQFDSFSISLVIPAYNEEESIAHVVRDFVDHVDEVLVVDNSSSDRTAELAQKAGARVETVSLSGYGDTIQWGLDNAKGDILIITEADHSFRSKDIGKFLEFLKDADMVMGTRTTREMIEQGSNMGGLLRLGNIVVGKLIEVLWWGQEPRFTDVGCTYRALWKSTWIKIREQTKGTGPEFSPEMMIEALRARLRVIEIPVSYHARVGGESKHSSGFLHVSKTALRMLRLILAKRLGLQSH
jgi:dTDP-glucose pyrophosphorylase